MLFPTDFSTFSEISEKSLSEMQGRSAVLMLEVYGSPIELVGESLLAFLLDDLSGIFSLQFVLDWKIQFENIY